MIWYKTIEDCFNPEKYMGVAFYSVIVTKESCHVFAPRLLSGEDLERHVRTLVEIDNIPYENIYIAQLGSWNQLTGPGRALPGGLKRLPGT